MDMYMCQLYILNMSLLYINYTFIKLFLKDK